MKLGLVATDERAGPHLLGLARAAADAGGQCRCFLTDTGVKLLADERLLALMRSGAVRVDACEHAWSALGLGAPPEGVQLRSQFQNAELAHQCERVVVL